MVDVGYNDKDYGKHLGDKFGVENWRSPKEVLAGIGLTPEDVDTVFVTHAHFDHFGNVEDFPNATFYIQEREMAKWVWAMALPDRNALDERGAGSERHRARRRSRPSGPPRHGGRAEGRRPARHRSPCRLRQPHVRLDVGDRAQRRRQRPVGAGGRPRLQLRQCGGLGRRGGRRHHVRPGRPGRRQPDQPRPRDRGDDVASGLRGQARHPDPRSD